MSTPADSQNPGSGIGWFNEATGQWDKSEPTLSEPITPYAGTSGHSGSSTSEDRARTQDADGTTSERQRAVLQIAEVRGRYGITVADLRAITDLHHGQASGALSVLHKEGSLFRLSEVRNRCKVYVLPEYVEGRETEPHGRRRATPANDGPPSGWYHFGTHAGWDPVDMPREMEMSSETDEGGLPLWERVVRR